MTAELPYCSTARQDHFGLCATLRINTAGFFEHTEAEHPGIELCFAAGGTRHQRRFRGKRWLVAADKVMVLNARERHVEECSANPVQRDLRSLIIHSGFIDALLADVHLRADELVFDDVLVCPTPDVKRALDAVFAAGATPGTSPVVIDCALTELVIGLTTRVAHSASAALRAFEGSGHYPGAVARARTILRSELGSPDLDLDRLANRAGLSKFHFVRAFRSKTGSTPIQYLNRLRVDVAKQKLLSRRTPVIEIASDVGFSDLSTFNKAFKRHAGMSPTQYRNFFRAGS